MEWTQVEERIVQDDRNKWDRKASAARTLDINFIAPRMPPWC
jgi:hypothetical protein